MTNGLRVAVAGASGIGKHHAKWHHVAGAEVVAFLGSSDASCRRTEAALRDIFPFSGRGYADWRQLLAEARPDAIDICVPNPLHYACALASLEAGCHVLCEKPMVWYPYQPGLSWLDEARALTQVAARQQRVLAMCTQYAAALPHYTRLYEADAGPLTRVERFQAEMETLSRGRLRSAADIWADMGPHPLSLLLAWLPDGRIAAGTLRVQLAGREARATFDFVQADQCCSVEIAVRDIDTGPPVRRFGINGYQVDVSGRNDAQGLFRCVLSHGSHEQVGDDFMALLVAQFHRAASGADAAPLVPGQVGVRNLELQLEVLAAAPHAVADAASLRPRAST